MSNELEIRDRFWKELKAERTIMLGIDGMPGGGMQPMTALIEDEDGGPIWIFTSRETELAGAIGSGRAAHATFTGKKHDLFASIAGQIAIANDPATIDRLWNPWVAAWFEGGRDDPKLTLLRFDAAQAKIWLNATPLGAAIEWLLRRDPKDSYKDKVAEVAL